MYGSSVRVPGLRGTEKVFLIGPVATVEDPTSNANSVRSGSSYGPRDLLIPRQGRRLVSGVPAWWGGEYRQSMRHTFAVIRDQKALDRSRPGASAHFT